MAMGSGIGYLASMVVAAITGRRIAQVADHRRDRTQGSGRGRRARAVVRRAAAGVRDLSALLADRADRGAAVRRCRQVVLVAAVVDGVVDWVTRNGNADDDTKRVGLLTYLLLKRLDDIAYGPGCGRAWCASGTSARSSRRSGPEARRLALRCSDRRCRQRRIRSRRTAFAPIPSCRVTVVEAGPGPADPRVLTQITDGLRLPIGDGQLGGAALSDHPDRRPRSARADHAGCGGRRIRGDQRRLLLPRAARRTSTAGGCRGGPGPMCCRTSWPSRPTSTSTARCTARTGRSSPAGRLNSTAAQHLSSKPRADAGYRLDR